MTGDLTLSKYLENCVSIGDRYKPHVILFWTSNVPLEMVLFFSGKKMKIMTVAARNTCQNFLKIIAWTAGVTAW